MTSRKLAPFPARCRRSRAAALLLGTAVFSMAIAQAAPAAASTATGAVFRCRGVLPGRACEMAGLAVRPAVGAGALELVVSVCSTPVELEPLAYCGGPRPTPELPGGVLLLREAAGHFDLVSKLEVARGFGGATWLGNGTYQAVYSQGGIARFTLGGASNAPAAIQETAFLPLPGNGRIGGLATDGQWLFAHETQGDRILVLNPASGAVIRELPVPEPQAVNGLAYLGGRLYAAINDDEMSGDSTGEGPVREAIVALDPADGKVLSRWDLPAGVYPHSMDALGPNSLAVMVQNDPGPLAPVWVWEFFPGNGGLQTVTLQPCP